MSAIGLAAENAETFEKTLFLCDLCGYEILREF